MHRRDRRRPGSAASRAAHSAAIFLAAVVLPAAAAPLGAQSPIELVSRVAPGAASGTATGSFYGVIYPPPPISADGRFVAFLSTAGDLVAGERKVDLAFGGFSADVFLRDRVAGTTTLVSHSFRSPTTTSNLGARLVFLSGDGSVVAFLSSSTDLLPDQVDASVPFLGQLYLFDRSSGGIEWLTRSSDRSSAVSESGRQVALSDDGRWVAFASDAPDLVPGQVADSRNPNLFLYDRSHKTLKLVSHSLGDERHAGNEASGDPMFSADGRYLVFGSSATDLVDGPSGPGIFLYDTTTGLLRFIAPGALPAISADGRFVAYLSSSRSLVPGQQDGNDGPDLFLQELTTGHTMLVDHSVLGPAIAANSPQVVAARAPAISGDGRFVAFESLATDLVSGVGPNRFQGLYLYDRASQTVRLVTRPNVDASNNHYSTEPSLSRDGHRLAFVAGDSQLVPGAHDDNGAPDVYVFELAAGTVRLGSVSATGPLTAANDSSSGIAISADGSAVAFSSVATDLWDGGKDLNNGTDVFVFDASRGANELVSRAAAGAASRSPGADSVLRAMTPDGRFVAYESGGANLVTGQVDLNRRSDVFLFDAAAKTTILVSRSRTSPGATGNGESTQPSVSDDGRFVAFTSTARDLVGDVADSALYSDVFLFDRQQQKTVLASRSAAGAGPANGDSSSPVVSADGRFVAFESTATDLIAGQLDAEHSRDVFLFDGTTGEVRLVSHANGAPAQTGDRESSGPALSADGRYVFFSSAAQNLVPGQAQPPGFETVSNLFLYDRVSGDVKLISHLPGQPNVEGGAAERAYQVTPDGRFVVFYGSAALTGEVDRAGKVDVYDRQNDRVAAVASAPYGTNGQLHVPRISRDGRFIAYAIKSDDPLPGFPSISVSAQVALVERQTGAVTVITRSTVVPNSPGDRNSFAPTLSDDGRFVAYLSFADDLVPGFSEGLFPQVYLFDRTAGTTRQISRWQEPSPVLNQPPGYEPRALLSATGTALAFDNLSPFLVGRDLNGSRADVFLFTQKRPGDLVPLPSCTLFDSRRPQDGPALRSNKRRQVMAHGFCGIPASARKLATRVTALLATGKGTLRFYPGDSTTEPTDPIRFPLTGARTATVEVPLAHNGTGTFAILPAVTGIGTVQVVVEVNGYFE